MTDTLRKPSRRAALADGLALAALAAPAMAHAASAAKISQRAREALDKLYASSPRARELGSKARAILVFPEIVKAGVVIGGEGGKGALFVGNRVAGFYSIGAASFGLQLGAQKFGYALFVITESAADYLRKSKGWAIGSGPSVVIVDEGFAKTINTTTLSKDVYAMAFNQRGLMAGAGLEGSKVSQIFPGP